MAPTAARRRPPLGSDPALPRPKVSELKTRPKLAPAHQRTASGDSRPPQSTTSTSTSHTTIRKSTERAVITEVENLVRRAHHSRSLEIPDLDQAEQWSAPPVDKKPAQMARAAAVIQRKPDVAKAVPWCPEASLIARTTAPLASRISIPPLASQMPASLQPRPLAQLTLEKQEAAVLEDLLYVFMGYEGQYIRFDKSYDPTQECHRLSGPVFKLLPGLDPSLKDLARSMLEMATYYSALEAFVDVQSREEFGAVNHALCAAVRKLLHDYLILVAQLETQFLTDDSFTMHVLNIRTLSTSQMMFQLYLLARELLKRNALLDDGTDDPDDDSDNDSNYADILESLREGADRNKICKGGAALDLVTRRLENLSGDPAARALLTSLLRDASRPYMAMLNEWLHRGGIHDPHSEFMIREQKNIRRERLEDDYLDDYWEKRYVLRDQDVPPQLEGVKDKVLLAGKYLNVVRECGGIDVSTEVRDVPTSFDDPRFLENVNRAYAHANESLMRLLLTAHALPARLGSLKHYFFLSPCDYFSYFLELGASELSKRVQSVNTAKLQSLLDLVLRQPGSVVSLDPFKEDVKVEMNEVTLMKSLQRVVNITGIEQGESLPPPLPNQPSDADKNSATGFSSLQLDYSVPFPVSLVISRKTIWRYQALFRYLLSLRHLESQLVASWQSHNRGPTWAATSATRRRTAAVSSSAAQPPLISFGQHTSIHSSDRIDPAAAAAAALEMVKRRVWTLRARMLVFVQQLLYYCTSEVIEPNWQRFVSRLLPSPSLSSSNSTPAPSISASAAPPPTRLVPLTAAVTRTVDELMQDHVDLLDTCLKECGLTNSKLLRIHSKLMQTCTVFANHSHWLSRQVEKAEAELRSMAGHGKQPAAAPGTRAAALQTAPTLSGRSETPDAERDGRVVALLDLVRKWEVNFSRHLQILLDVLNHYAATETVVLLGLCARLSTANQGTEYAGLRPEDDQGA